MKKDPRIDAYIQDAPPFAKSLLKHLRKLVRETCPQAEETIKWGKPWFIYNGKVLCGMVAFKAHFALLFNKSTLIVDARGKPARAAMGRLRRLSTVADLPPAKVLKSYLKQAMKLNEPGAKLPKRPMKRRPPVQTPPDLVLALRAMPKALAVYEAFIATNKRHYVDWINDAKTEETREMRLEKAVECIAAGKIRHWK